MPLRDAVLLSWELRSYRAALEQNGPVFFDRGVPDTLDYLRLTGLPVPDHIRNAAQRFRYASHVFIARHGARFFGRIASDEAERTYHALASIYTELGYELAPLLLAPLEARLRLSWPRRACSLSPDVKKAGNDPAFSCSRWNASTLPALRQPPAHGQASPWPARTRSPRKA
ncbi:MULTISPECIES: AAA family ATPase [Mesorhizobium]|uniref:AAA family ATPase n=1 Tax=Mesorhizobium sp. TaxID=1871066 RepID=UPI001F11AFB2|nr:MULTISPECIES: AAA family ATPase [Mesorhizobium]